MTELITVRKKKKKKESSFAVCEMFGNRNTLAVSAKLTGKKQAA